MEDATAFDAWYRQRHARVVGLLTAYCGDADAAADATDEAFARALADWRRVRRMASPDGWVYTVALNALRRAMRRRGVEERLAPAPGDLASVPPELAGEDADVWAAVRRLPPPATGGAAPLRRRPPRGGGRGGHGRHEGHGRTVAVRRPRLTGPAPGGRRERPAMTLSDAARRLEERPVRPRPPLPEVQRRASAIRRRRLAGRGAGLAAAALVVAGGAVALRGPDTVPVRTGPADTVTTDTDTDTDTDTEPIVTASTVVEGADGDLDVTLAAPVEASTGAAVGFDVTVTDPSGRLFGLALEPGDGSTVRGLPIDRVCGPVSWTDPTDVDDRLVHSYRAPGTYTATLTVVTGGCEAPVEEVEVTTTVVVVGTTELSNGPAAPVGAVTVLDAAAPGQARLEIAGSDGDGFVTTVAVDWGDGTAPSVVGADDAQCVDDPAKWTRSALLGEVTHHYAEPGRYTVSLVVTSAGCDGGTPQETTTSATVDVG